MTANQQILLAATLLSAVGLWLLLPRGMLRGRAAGILLGGVGLGLFASRWLGLGQPTADVLFWTIALTTLVSAVGAVAMRSPVYCAVWFALALLGTAGLFLLAGAQFLGVATIVVYAGAILVMFLFVLMLAQPRGDAYYDRVSWEGLLSASAGAVLVGILSSVVVVATHPAAPPPETAAQQAGSPQTDFTPLEPRFTAEQLQQDLLRAAHAERLGADLFSRHLIAVEVAAVLLLVALVGAAAIIVQDKPAAAGSTPPGALGRE